MENTTPPLLAVSDFIALTNQTLEYALGSVEVEGEVSGFKINQGKYVFFDLKDETGSVGCFMTVWQLRQPIEDGMKVVVAAAPRLTNWGKFSLTVRAVRPSGEGSLKRSFDLLKAKLESEGLFRDERKRSLPAIPQYIAVISSTQAAGYADFIKIINDRWGGLRVDVAHVQVQGKDAPDQIVRALRYFNSRDDLPQVIVIIRGGGSADDLSAFNDELLVREIAASRVPTIVGVGHETDTSLADLAADVRAATPSNAAQLVVPDKRAIIESTRRHLNSVPAKIIREVNLVRRSTKERLLMTIGQIQDREENLRRQLLHKKQLLSELDPQKVLARGYAITRGRFEAGQEIEVETSKLLIKAEVKNVQKRK